MAKIGPKRGPRILSRKPSDRYARPIAGKRLIRPATVRGREGAWKPGQGSWPRNLEGNGAGRQHGSRWMLRITIAALAVALSLQLWGTISSRFLPWPDVYGPQAASPAPDSVALPLAAEGESAARALQGSTFAPPAREERTLVATNGKYWPIHAYYRARNHYLSENGQLTYLALNISLGVIVALVVAIIGFQGSTGRRRLATLCLLGLAAILVTDISQGIWMHWPRHYVAVLCADHFVAAILGGGAAILVLHCWPSGGSKRAVEPDPAAAAV